MRTTSLLNQYNRLTLQFTINTIHQLYDIKKTQTVHSKRTYTGIKNQKIWLQSTPDDLFLIDVKQ
jgi:hypothetical protein